MTHAAIAQWLERLTPLPEGGVKEGQGFEPL